MTHRPIATLIMRDSHGRLRSGEEVGYVPAQHDLETHPIVSFLCSRIFHSIPFLPRTLAIEPVTSRTQNENHMTRPKAHTMKNDRDEVVFFYGWSLTGLVNLNWCSRCS